MRLLIQRVKEARVEVNSKILGSIKQGLCVFVAVEASDTFDVLQKMARRLCAFRIFEDAQKKMNLSVQDVQGSILLVPQFTLLADCRTGNRPSFLKAGKSEDMVSLFLQFVECVKEVDGKVETGEFQADMQVYIVNDGPATFMIESQVEKQQNKLDLLTKMVSENRPDLVGKQKKKFIDEACSLRANLELRAQQKKGN